MRSLFYHAGDIQLNKHALLTNMHIGHQADIIILDFAKAFNKVNHTKLIYQLKANRVGVLTVEWIEAFQSSRSQVVVLDGTSSDSVPVTSGVPQGSVLDPALFLLYINDLPDTIDSQVRLFADDTVFYLTTSVGEFSKNVNLNLLLCSKGSSKNHWTRTNCLLYGTFPTSHLCSVHVCMNTIDYNVLTGIAVIAAARYFARARESFRDD